MSELGRSGEEVSGPRVANTDFSQTVGGLKNPVSGSRVASEVFSQTNCKSLGVVMISELTGSRFAVEEISGPGIAVISQTACAVVHSMVSEPGVAGDKVSGPGVGGLVGLKMRTTSAPSSSSGSRVRSALSRDSAMSKYATVLGRFSTLTLVCGPTAGAAFSALAAC